MAGMEAEVRIPPVPRAMAEVEVEVEVVAEVRISPVPRVMVEVVAVSLAARSRRTTAPRHALPASPMVVGEVGVAPLPPVRYGQRAAGVVRADWRQLGPAARLGLVPVAGLPLARCSALDWLRLQASRSFSPGGRLVPRSETLLG